MSKHKHMKYITVTFLSLIILIMCLMQTYASVLNTDKSVVDIRAAWQKYKPVFTANPYEAVPSTKAPYAAGKLKAGFLQDGLNMANYVRYLAGLPDNLVLDASIVDQAQYGAVLLASSDFSHFPKKPADMDDDFYNIGLKATSSSNIGWGYYSIADSIRNGYMEDEDSSNISRIGHRRWLLNPQLQKIGFGYADSRTTTEVFDWSNQEQLQYDFIGWPAKGNFPEDLFNGNDPWSVTLNPEKFMTPSISDVKVKLTRKKDGKVWSFDNSNNTFDEKKDYFNVDTGGYGVSNCIIFRPFGIEKYNNGEAYNVEIDGLKDQSGGSQTLSYDVNFCSLYPVTELKFKEQNFDIPLGSTYQLKPDITAEEGTTPSLTWTSDKPSVASVDETGKIVAHSTGYATIQVSANDGTLGSACYVSVYNPVTEIKPSSDNLVVAKGNTVHIYYSIKPENAWFTGVIYKSSDESIAIVDSRGNIKGVSPGKAVITISSNKDNVKAEVQVEVINPILKILLEGVPKYVSEGQTCVVKASVYPNDASPKTLTWSSSNPSVATVDSTGKLTGLNRGRCYIIVKAYGMLAERNFNIEVIAKIGVKSPLIKISKGRSQKIILTGTYLSDKYSYSSSNPKVSTVNSSGVITAKSAGTAVITICSSLTGQTCSCKVEVR